MAKTYYFPPIVILGPGAIELIVPEIQKMKREVVPTREPGGVRVAEEIRQIILDPKNTEIDSKTELMLFAAARRYWVRSERIGWLS